MSFGKKAVSPLVATILLILFAVILGIIIMNIGGTYLAEKAPQQAEKADVLAIVDRCVASGAITQEEADIVDSSLK
jgi:flagellin-like protein